MIDFANLILNSNTLIRFSGLLADKWKHCIFVFDHKGQFVRRMCSKGHGQSALRSPEGIVFHPERSVLYVADTGNNRIQILEKDGAYLDSIGPKSKRTKDTVRSRKPGPGPSQLNQPTDVAVTTTRVAVADSGNHKVKVTSISIRERDAYIVDSLYPI